MSGGAEQAREGGQDSDFVRAAFSKIAARYGLTNHVLSGGLDVLWRRRVGRMVASWEPERILDVATGTGDLALEFQRVCGGAEVVAVDFCEEMLAHASRRGVLRTEVADAMALPYEDGKFGVVTVAFGLRNMAKWTTALAEMWRVLEGGGRLLVLDFSMPKGILRKPYKEYLRRVIPKVAGVLTGETEAYEYLGRSIEKFPSGAEMVRLLEDCGFLVEEVVALNFGVASIYVARKTHEGEVALGIA